MAQNDPVSAPPLGSSAPLASPAGFYQRHGRYLPAPPEGLARRIDVPPGSTEAEWNAAYTQRRQIYQERTGPEQPKHARLQNERLLRELQALRPVLDAFLETRRVWQLLGEGCDHFQAGQLGRCRNRLKEAAALLEKNPSAILRQWHDDLLADLEENEEPAVEPPKIEAPPELRARQNEPWTYAIAASGQPSAFSADGLPEGLVCHPQRGTITGVPRAAGSYPLILTAVNAGGRATAAVTLAVERLAPAMPPPRLMAPAEVAAVEGAAVAVNVTVWPQESRTTARGLPEGLRFDAARGEIAGVAGAAGEFKVVLTAVNEAGPAETVVLLRIAPKPRPQPRDELCQFLGLPAGTPLVELARARSRRVAFVHRLLRQGKLAAEERNKLEPELARLDAAEPAIDELKVISACETLFVETEDGLAREPPLPDADIAARLDQVGALLPRLLDTATRERFAQRLDDVKRIFDDLRKRRTRPPMLMFVGASLEVAGRVGEPLQHKIETVPPGMSLSSQTPFPEGLALGPDGRITGVPAAPGTRTIELSADNDGDSVKAVARIVISAQPPPATPCKGELLELLAVVSPGDRRTTAPIRLVARPRFTLGRTRALVDFVTWFLPENEENSQKTGTISKVNTTFSIRGTQVLVQDGRVMEDGSLVASANGTALDGKLIAQSKPEIFVKEGRLRIGGAGYELAVQHLPAVAPQGPRAVSAPPVGTTPPTVVMPQHPVGCLRFQPVSCREVLINAVWLLSEAAIGSDAACAVRLDAPDLPAVAARCHHWQGGFWLVVPAGAVAAVTLDGRKLAAGETVALQAAHKVSFGPLAFELKVS